MYHYYLERGHSLDTLLKLTITEQLFFMACMELSAEELKAVTNK